MVDSENAMLKNTVRRFLADRVAPFVSEMERNNSFDRAAFEAAGSLGFIAPYLPEIYGGAGLDLKSAATVYEEMSRIDAGFAMSVFVSAVLFSRNIFLWGTEEQRLRYLPPVAVGKKIGCWALTEPSSGSDAFSIQTVYVKDGDGYRLRGNKTFITNAPIADYFLIIARDHDDPGNKKATWFIMERGTEGLTLSKPFDKMGLCTSPTGEIFLDDVYVPRQQVLGEEGRGFPMMMQSLDVERCLGSVVSIGIASACLDASVLYSQQRSQFGKTISEFQLIKEKLAEMMAGIELARTYLYHTIELIQKGALINTEAAICKLFASQVAVRCASEAVQIHGGYGYIKEYPVERYYRDAKLYEIGGGTNEIQKLIIAGKILEKSRAKKA